MKNYMTAGQLKKMLENIPDDTKIISSYGESKVRSMLRNVRIVTTCKVKGLENMRMIHPEGKGTIMLVF